MPIEIDLTRIADALEALVAQGTVQPVPVKKPKKKKPVEVSVPIATPTVADVPVPIQPIAPPAEVPVVAEVPAPIAPPTELPVAHGGVPNPAPAPIAPPIQQPVATVMSPEELNAALVVEFKRIGNRESIDKVMQDMGIIGITSMASEQYQPLLDAIRAIQS